MSVNSGIWRPLARRQAGVITRAQCRSCGLSDHQIDHLLVSGALVPHHRGVLRVSGAPATELTSIWAAVLATRGVLISSTAVYLWQLTSTPGPLIELAVAPNRAVTAPRGVHIVRKVVPVSETTSRHGLPVSSRRCSCLDYLGSLDPVEAATFADRALSQGWLRAADISRRLESPSRGNGVLRKVLSTMERGAEAESERRLHRLLRSAGIRGWVPNYRVILGGRVVARIDVAFVRERLAIEIDGFAYHSARDRYQRDRTRQNLLVTDGWIVVRFTWEDITARGDHALAVIRAALVNAA